MLMEMVSRGLSDLYLLPSQALGEGSAAVIGALGQGVLSLLKHTSQGLCPFSLMFLLSLEVALSFLFIVRNIAVCVRFRAQSGSEPG